MDAVPKFADIQSLQGISKVIIIPMLTAASIIQFNFSAFGIFVSQGDGFSSQLFNFILVFFIHSFVVGTLSVLIHILLFLLQILSNLKALGIFSTLFLSFGFLGVYSENAPLIGKLNPMWFYSAFVCGFYFLSRASDIDNQLEVPFK